MKKEEEQTIWIKIARSPWMQGPFLGSIVMMLVTPGIKWTNHTFNGEKMSFRYPMSGALTYGGSATPGYATTFAVKALLRKPPEETSGRYDLFTSFAAGGISGLVSTPFEALAQNKQMTNDPSYKNMASKIIQYHGYHAFFRGGASIVMLEGLWSTVYMTAIPIMSTSLQEQGVKKQQAELLAVLTIAGVYGLLSTPLDQMRFKKQRGLTEPTTKNKRYLEHAKDIINQDLNGSYAKRLCMFFKAGLPRTITATVAAGLLVKSTELYNQTVDHFSQ